MAFDDEDDPSANAAAANNSVDIEEEEEPGEDLLPDFSSLTSSSFSKKGVSSKALRKGEKDFESHGTNAQVSVLEKSRRAMEDVLSYKRTHRPDVWCRGWYFPDWWEAEPQDEGGDGMWMRERVVVVEHERGGWLLYSGRSVPGEKSKLGAGKLWLLPEEALHLLERGTLDIWWPETQFEQLFPPKGQAPEADPDNYDIGLPLSLEAAYAMLIGDDGERGKITLSKYQVYAHLKRSGYVVLRAPTSTDWPQAPPQSLQEWLFSLIPSRQPLSHSGQPYGPLVQPGFYRSYRTIWDQLNLLSRHKPTPYPSDPTASSPPFQVFWHVWKPGGPSFSKKNPPPPDFRIAVADTAESSVPNMEELEALLESTPYDPPPDSWKGPGRMYQRLKHGYRNVLIAVVDAGLVNFMRFGEGAFGEESLVGRLDGWGPRGGKRGGRGGYRGRGRGRGGRRGKGGRR